MGNADAHPFWEIIEKNLGDVRQSCTCVNRPEVTLTYAQFADGSIARSRGVATSISSNESMVLTHRLRAVHDAILVGVGTVLSDAPRLNVRGVAGSDPAVVVLDSHLRTPVDAPFFATGAMVHLFCAADARDAGRYGDSDRVLVHRVETDETGTVDLQAVLRELASIGIDSVMIEGGGRVIDSVIRFGLADLYVVTVAARYAGGYRGVTPLPEGAEPFHFSAADVVGGDLMWVARR